MRCTVLCNELVDVGRSWCRDAKAVGKQHDHQQAADSRCMFVYRKVTAVQDGHDLDSGIEMLQDYFSDMAGRNTTVTKDF